MFEVLMTEEDLRATIEDQQARIAMLESERVGCALVAESDLNRLGELLQRSRAQLAVQARELEVLRARNGVIELLGDLFYTRQGGTDLVGRGGDLEGGLMEGIGFIATAKRTVTPAPPPEHDDIERED